MRQLFAVVSILLLMGCIFPKPMSVSELNSDAEKYLGEKVAVQGTVLRSIKLGGFSGFTLADENSTIFISSDSLPAEDSQVVVEGSVMKEMLVGYYVLADEVRGA